jgi:branched-chain amino acid transport system permease protein
VSCSCEVFSHSRLNHKGSPVINHLVASLGIYTILVQLIVLIWGSNTKVFRSEQDRLFEFLGLILTRSQLIAGLTLAVVLAALGTWIKASRLGLLLRGLAFNPTEMQLIGHPVPLLRLLTFGISGGLV